MKRYAIIVAGGSGTRMGAEIPKQFIVLSGKPLLMYTLESFTGYTPAIQIILVLPGHFIEYWQELCFSYHFIPEHRIIAGGSVRGESVRNGLNSIDEPEALVAIHDGVRPFADFQTTEKAFNFASLHGAAVPVREITDSVRVIDGGRNRPFDRNMIRSIQTPQCFKLSVIRRAYNSTDFQNFTDDASLVGSLGYSIHLFEGNAENLKITTPFDLIMAEAIIRNKQL